MNPCESPTQRILDEQQQQEQPLNFSTNHTIRAAATVAALQKDSESSEGSSCNGRNEPAPFFAYQPSIFMAPGLLPSSYMSSFAAAAAMSAAMNAATNNHRFPQQSL
ncbi:unnamed protein product [Gongylonema pulchrum]|uniref:Homeobox domain-containing protein n=1 Tax=Gongylonema pulchrum TaxID=637853 RepID=A0A183D6W1_9BILA|nr:unnamed protein product [Gongylonema pulchrum]